MVSNINSYYLYNQCFIKYEITIHNDKIASDFIVIFIKNIEI
jgi:hypothetical protein